MGVRALTPRSYFMGYLLVVDALMASDSSRTARASDKPTSRNTSEELQRPGGSPSGGLVVSEVPGKQASPPPRPRPTLTVLVTARNGRTPS
jgi:hypothetical protein